MFNRNKKDQKMNSCCTITPEWSATRKQSATCDLLGVYAASRISSNLKGSTKQFGWLQAAATEDSFVSVISMNPATIRICTP
jgi:hypothetical protein